MSKHTSILNLSYGNVATYLYTVTALECVRHYPLHDRHHVILSSHAGYMAARILISIVSMHSCTPYIHTHHMLTHTHTLHTCCSFKWYFLSSLMCAFSSAAFCRRKMHRVFVLLRQGAFGQISQSVGEGEE